MQKTYAFHGGIHIKDDHKIQGASILTLPDADTYILPLKQHIGGQITPIVKVGDNVKKYQCIATANTPLASHLHAPVSGEIIGITENPLIHPDQMSDTCIIIKNDFKEESLILSDDNDLLTPETIAARIKSAGIIGLGGAGFPSYAKLKSGITHLIINAAECEPYISCDDALMQTYFKDIVAGIQIVQQLTNPKYTTIGIEDNKPEAITAMQRACIGTKIKVHIVPTIYPSGGEKQLIKLLTDQSVPKAVVHKDILCYNIATIYSIQQAVTNQTPLIERVVTVTGNACAKSGNYLLKIGTPVAHIIAQTGIKNYTQLIHGGPMMGFGFNPEHTGITKTTNCIIAADANEATDTKDIKDIKECIRCGKCTEVCPMRLLPQQLYWHSQDLEKSAYYHIDNCIECACCDYVCPSDIPLAQYFRATKAEIREKALQDKKSDHAMMRHEQREARLIRVEAQRQEKLAKQRAAIKEKIAKKKAAEKEDTETDSETKAADDKQAIIEAAKKRTQPKQADKDL